MNDTYRDLNAVPNDVRESLTTGRRPKPSRHPCVCTVPGYVSPNAEEVERIEAERLEARDRVRRLFDREPIIHPPAPA